ncbi:MAG: tetratricopeptide repeat protein, partial [Rudaea sp.]
YRGLMKLANEQGDPARALTYAQAALAQRIAEYGPDSQKAGTGYYDLGYALEATGQFDDAANAYRHVHEIDLLHLAPGSFDLMEGLGGEGAAELFAGQLHAGRDHLREALKIADHVGGKPRELQASYAEQLCFAGLTMAPAAADKVCARATQLDTAVFGATSARYGLGLRLTGMLAIERGELVGARATLNQSTALLATADNVAWRGRTAITLGEVDLIEGRNDEAVQALATGIEQFGKSYPPHLRRIGLALLALACDRAPAPNCPANAFEHAATELAAVAYQWNPMLLPAQIALARVDLAHARVAAASERLRTAIAHAENEVDSTQPRLLEARLWLADAEAAAGSCDTARASAQATVLTVRKNHLETHPLLAAALKATADSKPCGSLVQ